MSSSSSAERGRRRWDRARLPVALLAVAVVAALVPAEAHQAVSTDPVTLEVEGAPLADLSTSGLKLAPAFSPATTDYVLRCRPGINSVDMTLAGASGASIRVGSLTGPQVSSSVALVENQALVVEAPGAVAGTTVAYWIRCLPSDFPELTVSKPGNPPPGWYLTGNIGSAGGSGTYAMILDSNGTPVWYQKTAGEGAINVTPVAKNVLAWASDPGPGFGTDPNATFSVYDVATQRTSRLTTATKPLDYHELLPLADGNFLLLASPLRAAVDLRSLGLGRDQTIVDCVIEEVTANGSVQWRWRASNHISVAESLHPFPVTVNRQLAYDVFHCNSIDQDSATGDLLLSAHNMDAVYRIRKSSGEIAWKLGGNATVADGEQHLIVRDDPEGTFHGQHDARFESGNNISLYDNHTWYLGAARGIEYHLDAVIGTATPVWEYRAPDGGHSAATGSFRRYQDGADNLIAWGLKPKTLFTEVDSHGNVLLDVDFQDGEPAYRTLKTPLAEFDVDQLRRTAGLASDLPPAEPKVLSVSIATSGPLYDSTATILGTRLAATTEVKFGAQEATAFTVVSDNMITAVAPATLGKSQVTVVTPGGSSPATTANFLIGSDGNFADGTGSWKPNVNASLSLAPATGRSRPYALAIRRKAKGPCSGLTSPYEVAGNAVLTGSVWAKARVGSDQVRTSLIFYDSRGTVIWTEEGPAIQAASSWVHSTVVGTSPAAATSVSLAVDGTRCSSALYVDDASMRGSAVFDFRGGRSGSGGSNLLTTTDAGFENGPGSWVGNVNASTAAGTRSRSGRYSLLCRPLQSGFQSVISGMYPAAEGSDYSLSAWVNTPGVTGHLRPFMIFYGPAGEILAIEQGPEFVRTSAKDWTRLRLTAQSPRGTGAVAVGVDDADGRGDLYVDDVSLTGSNRFTYR